MKISLQQEIALQIQAGIKRSTLRKCSVWATRYRHLHSPTYKGPFSFERYPWLLQIHDDDSEMIVNQKAAQMGLSEYAINRVFYKQDIFNESALYLLPNSKPDASDFSVGRFEPALALSPHLNEMYSDTKNVGMKKAGSAILYIRGSRSESQLKSIPTGLVIFDEFDEMPRTALPLAMERASGQAVKQFILISTATVPDFGINREYMSSDQKHFFFRCPHCGQLEELTFPDSIVITAEYHTEASVADSHLICKKTKRELPHELKHEWLKDNEWVAQNDSIVSGYHINQLYSPTSSPSDFAKAYLKGIIDPFAAQEFAKSKLGAPYVEKGARVTDEELTAATGRYAMATSGRGRFTVMGVDIGTNLHYEITEYRFEPTAELQDINTQARGRVLRAGHVKEFHELDQLMNAFGIIQCVLDANPETRSARQFATRFPGRVKLCYYIVGLSNANPIQIDADNNTVKVDRTTWLDTSLSRFRNGTITIPADIDAEYKPHMKSLVRRYEEDKSGNPVAKYVKTGHDHLGHARNYNEIALRVAGNIGNVQNMSNPI